MSFPETVVLTYGEVKAESSAQRAPLGTRGVTPDGRVFRYAKAGGALKIGWPVQAEIAFNITGLYGLSSSKNLPIAAGTTHTSTWTYIQVETSWLAGTTAVIKDQWAEGYLFIGSCADGVFTTSTGVGQIVAIKEHSGGPDSSTEHTQFHLADGDHLVEDVSTDHSVGLMKNPYKDVLGVTQAASPTSMVMGVALTNITSGYYFWCQTWGPAVLACGEACVIGNAVNYSTDAGDSGITEHIFSSNSGADSPILGHTMIPAIASDYVMIMLQLSP